MRFISKSPEPVSLTKIRELKQLRFKPRFQNLPPNVLNDILQQLLQDQGHLCCYTMDEITAETAVLVHLHPIDFYPDRELDYRNMYLALQQAPNLPPEYRVGYMSKEEAVIPDYLSDVRCHSFFRYNTLGEIVPAGTFRTIKKCRDNFRRLSPAQQLVFCTIEVLNLNAEHLKHQRRQVYAEVLKGVQKVGKSQIPQIVEKLRQKDKKGNCAALTK
ncbi:MAG: hypothetical protein HC913_02920 [Microscillaceae bacterium]|nr:hypothetical protein [Microscillaceae bacterium]